MLKEQYPFVSPTILYISIYTYKIQGVFVSLKNKCYFFYNYYLHLIGYRNSLHAKELVRRNGLHFALLQDVLDCAPRVLYHFILGTIRVNQFFQANGQSLRG